LNTFPYETLNGGRVLLEATLDHIQTAVKTLILSIILLDAYVTTGFAGFSLGLGVLVLVIPAVQIARFL
jgi:hypothetical protein